MTARRLATACAALLLWLQLLPGMAQGSFTVAEDTPAPVLPLAPTPVPAETPAPFTAWPALDEAGFLPAPLSDDAPAFIFVDEEEGRWIYIDQDLKVQIERHRLKVRYKWVYYFISHIHFRNDTIFRAWCKDPADPAKGRDKPENIARQHDLVYAQNGDLFTWRIEEKRYPGLIIRDGKIVREQTYSKANSNIPPLDELSLYPDGHMEVHTPGELTGADYLRRGALDVFAFGPLLLRDGEKDPRPYGNFQHLEPRSAIGQVAPGHFVGIMVEGRNKRSAGAGLPFVQDRLLEQGCHTAFTLDGGQTAAMVFMGRTVMDPGTYNGYTKTRRQPDVIGIGVSTQAVPGWE